MTGNACWIWGEGRSGCWRRQPCSILASWGSPNPQAGIFPKANISPRFWGSGLRRKRNHWVQAANPYNLWGPLTCSPGHCHLSQGGNTDFWPAGRLPLHVTARMKPPTASGSLGSARHGRGISNQPQEHGLTVLPTPIPNTPISLPLTFQFKFWLILYCLMTLGKSFNFSGPRFPHL